jgi:hypothetical protein
MVIVSAILAAMIVTAVVVLSVISVAREMRPRRRIF